MKNKPGFTFQLDHIGADGKLISSEMIHNLMPTVAVDYVLNAAFRGGTAYSNYYMSLYTANRTPVDADTMTLLLADCVEETTYTTTSTNRLLITLPAPSSGVITPSATVFPFTGAATVRGAFITTNITRGNNGGLLISAVLFASAKTMAAGESLSIPSTFTLADTL